MKDKFIKTLIIIFIAITFIISVLLAINNVRSPTITQSVIISNNIEHKLNINNATKEELMLLPGIGEIKANNIIDYRQNKKFNTIEELDNVKGIGQETIKILRELVTI